MKKIALGLALMLGAFVVAPAATTTGAEAQTVTTVTKRGPYGGVTTRRVVRTGPAARPSRYMRPRAYGCRTVTSTTRRYGRIVRTTRRVCG